MSQFQTTIPIAVLDTLAKLPQGSVLHPYHALQLTPDKKGLLVTWETDAWQTPYSRPLEISLDMLEGREALPGVVKRLDAPADTIERVRTAAAPDVATLAGNRRNRRT